LQIAPTTERKKPHANINVQS
jgi:hypothetical protein